MCCPDCTFDRKRGLSAQECHCSHKDNSRTFRYRRHQPCKQVFVQPVEPKEDEDCSGSPLDELLWDFLSEENSHTDTKCIRYHHPCRRTGPDRQHRLVFRRQSDRGQLGLVPHFRDKERYGNRPEGAEAESFVFILQFITGIVHKPKRINEAAAAI